MSEDFDAAVGKIARHRAIQFFAPRLLTIAVMVAIVWWWQA